MQLSMWTYPWDVQDLGHDTVERDLVERAGLNMVSLGLVPAARLDWVRGALRGRGPRAIGS